MTISEYNKFVDNQSDSLYRFALKNIKDCDMAQDIVQESFVRMWEKRATVVAEKGKSYLFTTAYHLVIDAVRHQNRFAVLDASIDPVFEREQTCCDLQEIINQAIEKLPVTQKMVLLLRDYEGYSYEEIGTIAGLSESQVKVYIYRARLFLKKYIGNLEAVI